MSHLKSSILFPLPALVLLIAFVLPLILGSDTLLMRDVFNTHLPQKYSHAEALREGYLPLIDVHRAGGQPALGNPNGSMLYPDNLLLLVADSFWVINMRFWLHWLLAPLSMFLLCRRFGLDPLSSWVGGILYATSGHFASQLNFYNLVAGVALTPALIAAVLGATSAKTRLQASLWSPAIAIFWGLLLVSGDPMTAAQAFALAMLAWLLSGQLRLEQKRAFAVVVAAFFVGTLLAAPQLLEFQRILGLSDRGYRGFSADVALHASWDPRRLAEWFLPLLFGPPDARFWGARFHDNDRALFYSLYPGLLTLAFVTFSGKLNLLLFWRQRRLSIETARLFSWLAIAAGVFFALGRWNGALRWLAKSADAPFRYPIKFWLPVAIGTATLGAVGFARTLSPVGDLDSNTGSTEVEGDEERRGPKVLASRGLLRLLLAASAAYALLFVAIHTLAPQIETLIASLMPPMAPAQIPTEERLRLGALSVLSALFLLGFATLVLLSRKRPFVGGSLLLAFHTATQLFFMQSLVETDKVSIYRAEPPLLAYVAPGELVVQPAFTDIFGPRESETYPGPQQKWVQRRGWTGLYPSAGVGHGVSYDLNTSPEGLDSFLTTSASRAMKALSDQNRVRLLRALGVDVLILGRPLAQGAEAQVRLRKRIDVTNAKIYLYQLQHSAREVELVGSTYRAKNLNDSLARLVDPTFNPRREVILPGEASSTNGPGGRFHVVSKGPEAIRVRTASEHQSVLVWRRAFLPLYSATIDGEPARVLVANQTRIGIELEPGEHEVHIFVDRSTLRIGLVLACLGLVLLPMIGWLGHSSPTLLKS